MSSTGAPEDAAGGVDLGRGEVEPELGLVAEQLEAAREGLDDADLDRVGSQDRRHWQSSGKRCRSCAFRIPRRDRFSMAFLRFPATMARKADAVYRVTSMAVGESLCGL